MSALINDIKYALRQLRKRPGFSLAVILTLAIGLTVNAVVFSGISECFLRPLPVGDPDNLVVIAQKSPRLPFPYGLSYPDFLDLCKAIESPGSGDSSLARTFAGLMAYSEQAVHLSHTPGTTEYTWFHVVSHNYFSVLKVQPLLGRLFLPGEGQQEGKDPIIVLTHRAWQRRFGANPDVIGQSVKLNDQPFTVVGVTRPGFHGAALVTAVSGFVPASMAPMLYPQSHFFTSRGGVDFFLMGRLHRDVRMAQARQAMQLAFSQLVQEYTNQHRKDVRAVVMRERLSRPYPYIAGFLPLISTALMGLAFMVLIVAIANVSHLLFARVAHQQRELAIRGALGASRRHLICQLLVETVLLALGAGIVGTAATFWLIPYLDSLASTPTAPVADLGMDWRLFVFTFLASLITGILSGLLPALKATHMKILPLLNESTRSLVGSRHPWRSFLVSAQVAGSVVVLVCAGLAVRSFHHLSTVSMGFRTNNLLLATFDLRLQQYTQEQGQRFYHRLLNQVRTLPGVTHATLAQQGPFEMGGIVGTVHAEGAAQSNDSGLEFVACIAVDELFLQTTDIAIREGRGFRPLDNESGPRVAIVNQVVADRLWPNEHALGQSLLIHGRKHKVIGIIGTCRYWSITDRNRPLVFRPLAQNYQGQLTLMVRTTGPSGPLRISLEQLVRQLDPDLPLSRVRTIEQHIADSPLGLMPMRIGANMAGIQAALALALAALGITGMVSFTVTQRIREIGIRMALGARAIDVIGVVTRQSLRLTFVGLFLGLVMSLGVAHLLNRLFYHISPWDPVVFTAVVLLIVITALFAGWLPARRAAKIDPMEALRYE